ncbi:MAG: peptidylprolyl isomerase [Lachnospiraceae bacterium]|nr:peptidylprolyl isomerase [Lachnospiraceae bacterium]
MLVLKRSDKRFSNRIPLLVLLAACICLILSGCGKKKTEIVLTTEFEEGEIFRIERLSCYAYEAMVYMVNTENGYSELFGPEIFKARLAEGDTVEERYKETVLARLAQIKAMNLMAQDRKIELDEDTDNKIRAAARVYMDSLNESEILLMGVDEEKIYNMYHEYAVADKLYHSITDAVNPEISDDAARTITIGSILVKTYRTDNYGNRVDYTADQKLKAYERAVEIQNKLLEGTEFDVLCDSYYNEDDQTEYTFGRGVMPYAIEQAAFSLSSGEVSDIIETEYGYHIIKCRSTFNKEETAKNKVNIVNQKKQEAFNNAYTQYIKDLKSNLNEPLWLSLTYTKTDQINTKNFFDLYDSYFTVISDGAIN